MSIDILAAALDAAKHTEAQATAARIVAETALVALLGCKDEGSATHKGAAYKVTLTGVMHRRVDEAELGAVRERLSPAMFERAFRFKPEVSVTGVKYLRDNEPELYAIAAQAIVATPGKPSVRIEHLAANDAAA